MRKVTKRLLKASKQFGPYPGRGKRVILSTLRLGASPEEVRAVAERFVSDGTLDEIVIVGEAAVIRIPETK